MKKETKPLENSHKKKKKLGKDSINLQHPYSKVLKKKIKDMKKENHHTARYFLTKSIDRIRPFLDLQRVRRKGRTYYIPYGIKKEKARIQGMKWLQEGSQKASKGTMQSIADALANLLIESIQRKGGGYAQKKQKEHHKLALTNKSYTRFRWW